MHIYINIIFSHNLHVIQTSNNTQKLDFNLQSQRTAYTAHNQNHPAQIPNYGTTISSRTVVLKTNQTQKPVPTNNLFLFSSPLCFFPFSLLFSPKKIALGGEYLSRCRTPLLSLLMTHSIPHVIHAHFPTTILSCKIEV